MDSIAEQKLKDLRSNLCEIYQKKLTFYSSTDNDAPDFHVQFLQDAINFEKQAGIAYKQMDEQNKFHDEVRAVYGYAILQVVNSNKTLGENVFKDSADKLCYLVDLLEPIKNKHQGHWLYCSAVLLQAEINLLDESCTEDLKKTVQEMIKIGSTISEYEKTGQLKPWSFNDILGNYDVKPLDLNLSGIQDMACVYILLAARYLKYDDIMVEHGIKGVKASLRLASNGLLTASDVIDYTCRVCQTMIKRHCIKQSRHLIAVALSILDKSTITEEGERLVLQHSVNVLCLQYYHRILTGFFGTINLNTAKFFQKEITTGMLETIQINQAFEEVERRSEIEVLEREFPENFRLHLAQVKAVIEAANGILMKTKVIEAQIQEGLTKVDYAYYEKYFLEASQKLSYTSEVTNLTSSTNDFLDVEKIDEKLKTIKDELKLKNSSFMAHESAISDYLVDLTELYCQSRTCMEEIGIFHKAFKSFVPLAGTLALMSVKILQRMDYKLYSSCISERLEQLEYMLEVFRLLPQGLFLYLTTLFYKANMFFLNESPTVKELLDAKFILEKIQHTYDDYQKCEKTDPWNIFDLLDMEMSSTLLSKNDKLYSAKTVLRETEYSLVLVAVDLNEPDSVLCHGQKYMQVAVESLENSDMNFNGYDFVDQACTIVYNFLKYQFSMKKIFDMMTILYQEYKKICQANGEFAFQKCKAKIYFLFGYCGWKFVTRSKDIKNFEPQELNRLLNSVEIDGYNATLPTELSDDGTKVALFWKKSLNFIKQIPEVHQELTREVEDLLKMDVKAESNQSEIEDLFTQIFTKIDSL